MSAPVIDQVPADRLADVRSAALGLRSLLDHAGYRTADAQGVLADRLVRVQAWAVSYGRHPLTAHREHVAAAGGELDAMLTRDADLSAVELRLIRRALKIRDLVVGAS